MCVRTTRGAKQALFINAAGMALVIILCGVRDCSGRASPNFSNFLTPFSPMSSFVTFTNLSSLWLAPLLDPMGSKYAKSDGYIFKIAHLKTVKRWRHLLLNLHPSHTTFSHFFTTPSPPPLNEWCPSRTAPYGTHSLCILCWLWSIHR